MREQDAEARAAWREQMAKLAPTQLVFLDETSTPLGLTPLRARAPRGARTVGRDPQGRWANVPLLATVTTAGMSPDLQVAGALDRPLFETFVERLLVPTLRPGQEVVLDNLSVHNSARARSVIEAAGCQVDFLPTYSLDYNLIEQAVAKLKQRLRQVEARTIEAAMRATQHAYRYVTASDAQGFFRAAWYS